MHANHIREFLQRFDNDSYTDEEHQQFIDWLRTAPVAEAEAVAEQYRLIAEAKLPQVTYRHQLVNKIEAALDELPRGRIMPLYRQTWFRVAAAVLVIMLGAGIYFAGIKKQTGTLVSNKQPAAAHDVLPGNDKAILIMGDGRQVVLTNDTNSILKEKNGQQISNNNGALSYAANASPVTEVVYNTIQVPRKGQYRLQLSDGTKVWLNAESSLKYPTSFQGNERRVEITGEAYFEVAKNAAQPFHVLHNNMDVTVLGTHFNVNTYDNESEAKVTLLEGSVKVESTMGNRQSAILKPGQQAVLIHDSRLPAAGSRLTIHDNIDLEETVAWKEGRFQFKDASLQTIIRQLVRWYDIEVEYKGTITDRYFTANISRTKNLSSVIKILEMSNIHCSIEGNKLIVKP